MPAVGHGRGGHSAFCIVHSACDAGNMEADGVGIECLQECHSWPTWCRVELSVRDGGVVVLFTLYRVSSMYMLRTHAQIHYVLM